MSLIKHNVIKGHYTPVPHYIAQGLGNLSSGAKVLYIFLYSQGEKYKPTIDGLTYRIYEKGKRISRSSVVRQVKELKMAGLLKIDRTAFKEHVWHLYDPEWRRESINSNE